MVEANPSNQQQTEDEKENNQNEAQGSILRNDQEQPTRKHAHFNEEEIAAYDA